MFEILRIAVAAAWIVCPRFEDYGVSYAYIDSPLLIDWVRRSNDVAYSVKATFSAYTIVE